MIRTKSQSMRSSDLAKRSTTKGGEKGLIKLLSRGPVKRPRQKTRFK